MPGLPGGKDIFDALIGIWFEADVSLPWDPDDSGAIAPFEGGASTHGSRGTWPLPPDARVLTFSLIPPRGDGESFGKLVVHLDVGAARWVPLEAKDRG